jgi:death-on-curing protein
LGAAFQVYGGVDPHPAPFDKAAMLLRGITQGHPFNDGNKRTGFLIAAYYLNLVGFPFPARFDFDAAEALTVGVSAKTIRDVAVIAAELERLWMGNDRTEG